MVRVGVRFLRIVASVQSRTRSTYESPYSLVWLSGQLVVPERSKLCACSGPGPARAIRPFQPMNWLETPVNLIPSCSVEISGSFHHKSTRRMQSKRMLIPKVLTFGICSDLRVQPERFSFLEQYKNSGQGKGSYTVASKCIFASDWVKNSNCCDDQTLQVIFSSDGIIYRDKTIFTFRLRNTRMFAIVQVHQLELRNWDFRLQ